MNELQKARAILESLKEARKTKPVKESEVVDVDRVRVKGEASYDTSKESENNSNLSIDEENERQTDRAKKVLHMLQNKEIKCEKDAEALRDEQ